MMKRLWAPWRKAYIRPKAKKNVASCLFCRLINEKKDKKNLILKRGALSYAVLNLFPYNNGHILIIPNRHLQSLSQLSSEEQLDLLDLANQTMNVLEVTMKAKGFNVGLNLGSAAGAGIPDHLHLHVVPRWFGDHNFMPVIGKTKVISESLKSSYQILCKALASKKKKR